MSWNPPLFEHQNGKIRYYKVKLMLSNLSAGYQDSQIFTLSTPFMKISNLYPYHNYTFTITAITLKHGPESNPLTFQTLEDGMQCKL